MATASVPANAAQAKSGKKKLIVILLTVLLLVAAGGGVAIYLMRAKAAQAEGDEESAPAEHRSGKIDLAHPPSFLPLDPFVVNLVDKDVDRYAQIGITLEVETPVFAEQMKTFMPAVRSSILLILANKTSKDLLSPEGKEALAAEIMREAVRPMGIEIDPEDADGQAGAEAEPLKPTSKVKRKKRKAPTYNPVRHVHFSNFIIQ